MSETTKTYGVWDTRFNDWDSGPYPSVEAATRGLYGPLPKGVDVKKYRRNPKLQIREWLADGEAGPVVS